MATYYFTTAFQTSDPVSEVVLLTCNLFLVSRLTVLLRDARERTRTRPARHTTD
jgi:hypothetical protein